VGLAVDWQPYLYGRWTYGRTGLVWVSYEPWGWAPFHYGRWEFLVGTGRVWIPGHVFSGDYVAWSVAPGGYFGWCPLGYYNYPVSFHFGTGHHRDPWVYVRGHHLYNHRVQTVRVRDERVLREIETQRVVVRGRPIVSPRRIQSAPALAEEFHRVAKTRPELRLEGDSSRRRMPFHEVERQVQVRLNNRSVRGANPGVRTVGSGGTVRSAPIVPRGNVNVPQRRQSAAEIRRQRQERGRSQGSNVQYDSTPRSRPAQPGRTRVEPRTVNPRTSTPRAQTPQRQQPPTSVERRNARPDRAIPRIFTRRPARQQPATPEVKRPGTRTSPPDRNRAKAAPQRRQPQRPKQAAPERRGNDKGKKSGSGKGKKPEKKD